MMSDSTSTKIDFLKAMGADEIPHSGRTLLEHLVGVFNILKDMDVAQHVQDAGLYHSIYGTAVFHHQTTSDRCVVQGIIGEDAEHLVYLFCILGRETDRQTEISVIDDKEIRKNLMIIDYANNEEQNSRKEMTLEEAYGYISYDSGRA
jgi:hypothetical protein